MLETTQETTYELKYCERCGSLGLRRSQSAANYCERCEQILINCFFPVDPVRRALLRRPGAEPQCLKLEGGAQSWFPFGRLQ
jgi:ribosomal protein L37AE/L43A